MSTEQARGAAGPPFITEDSEGATHAFTYGPVAVSTQTELGGCGSEAEKDGPRGRFFSHHQS